ncbi:MAG: Holliday junction branch migration protein RuvA [Patescibacteria group bacterium]
MIGSLRGKVILKTEKFLVVESGGVGYKINATPETISKVAGDAFLWTHTHVREDAIELYGFENRENLEFFEMLLSVPSIGPKSALAILGIATLETLRKAVSTGDTAYLTKVSGIGRKTAEKIVVELRDKISDEGGTSLAGELDALEALKSLGYSQSEAREALKKVSGASDTNAKIKEALKILGGR